MKMFVRKFGEFLWTQIAVGLVLAVAILWQQMARGLISAPSIKANILAVATPYLYLVGVLLVWHLGRTAFLLHVEDQLEIEGLRHDVERLTPQPDPAVTASANALAEIIRLIDTPDLPQSIPSDAPKVIIDFDRAEKRDMVSEPLGLKLVRNRKVKLKNRGGDAFDVQIETMNLEEVLVTFPMVPSILSDGETEIAPLIQRKDGVEIGHVFNKDLDIRLREDYETAGKLGKHKGWQEENWEHVVPINVLYCDITKKNWYRTSHQIRFDLFHHTVATELLGYEQISKPQ